MSKEIHHQALEYVKAFEHVRVEALLAGVTPPIRTEACLSASQMLELVRKKGKNAHLESCPHCQKGYQAFLNAVNMEPLQEEFPQEQPDPMQQAFAGAEQPTDDKAYPRGNTSIAYFTAKDPLKWPEFRTRVRPTIAAWLYACQRSVEIADFGMFLTQADQLLEYIQPRMKQLLDGSRFSDLVPNWARDCFQWGTIEALKPNSEELVVHTTLFKELEVVKQASKRQLCELALRNRIATKDEWFQLDIQDADPMNRANLAKYQRDVMVSFGEDQHGMTELLLHAA